MSKTIDYLNPNLPPDLPTVRMPIVDATPESLEGYGVLIDGPDDVEIEIVRWPAQGWPKVDEDSGDEGGTTEGVFVSHWDGDILFGSNEAVGGEYVLAYGTEPNLARQGHANGPERLLIWHANYHPDGGQLFFPLDDQVYYVPMALPGDDVRPGDFKCFRFSGNKGCYMHPNVWHEGTFAAHGKQRFFDRQGRVHARVSVNFAEEFKCLLEVELRDSE